MKKKWGRIGLTILILAVMVIGYGGLCNKKSSDDDTSSGGSGQTTPTPPAQVTSPLPSDGAIDVITTTQLSWVSASGSDSYDVYFDITTTGWTLITNTINTTYNPGTLLYNTTYYWRIDSKNNTGTTIGNVWSFQTIPPFWIEVETGSSHTIALKSDGTLWAWGYNKYGQLGLGDTNDRWTPTSIGLSSDWSTVAGGRCPFAYDNHTIGLKTNSTIWSWGINNSGQLGLGDTIDRWTPTQIIIGTDSDWLSIAAGIHHSLACKTNSTVWAWGNNIEGELGLGDTLARNTPTQVGTTSNWSAVASGGSHTLGLKTNGTLWAWGYNYTGQLGLGNSGFSTNRNTPTSIGIDSDWIAVTAGFDHTLARKTNGTIWSWGNNAGGQLGLGDTIGRNTPFQIGIASDWSALTAGSHTLVIKTNGILWAWGYNTFGQLGLGDTIARNTPTQVGTTSDWFVVKGRALHNFSFNINKNMWGWGNNQYGQLGLGDTIDRWTPTMIGQ